MSRAIVLGCGPAGLLAAHACELAGLDTTVISRKVRSRLGGSQFLHHAIPDLTPDEPEGLLTVTGLGTASGYADKVYGDPDAVASWGEFVQDEPISIWDMVTMYDELWSRWEDRIVDTDVTVSLVDEAQAALVVSTIPATVLCHDEEHQFHSQAIKVLPEFMSGLYFGHHQDNVIIYNGDPWFDWYRSSRIFGRGMTELSDATAPIHMLDLSQWFDVNKPLSTDCDCFGDKVLKVGRFGKWHKGDLVTDAFDEVHEHVSS